MEIKLSEPKKKKLLFKLEEQKTRLEHSQQVIKDYVAWRKMNWYEQEVIRKEWGGYYERLKKTQSYERYCRTREAFKNKDIALVKEIALEAKEALEKGDYLPKPRTTEPELFVFSTTVIYYKGLLNRIDSLKKDLIEDDMLDEIF